MHRAKMSILLFSVALLLVLYSVQAQRGRGESSKLSARNRAGQSVGNYADPLEPAIRDDIRVVYQIKTDGRKSGKAAGLHYLEKLIRQYRSLDIGPSQRRVQGVFHGDAGHFLLKDEAYRAETGKPHSNPNKRLVADLLKEGVRLELCKSTMQSRGWTGDDVLPGVKIVVAAYPRIIDLQQQGYAYIRF